MIHLLFTPSIHEVNAVVLRSTAKLHLCSKMSQEFIDNIVYKSMDSVLAHLNKSEFRRLHAVQELLNIYSGVVSKNSASIEDKKFPLVVLEGLDGCGKSTQTERVTNELRAELFCTPPPCIRTIRDKFDSSEYKEVRTAYYALGNYIAAIEMTEMLQTRPVVLDRFWHSTAAFAIGQAIADNPDVYSLPSEGHEIYNWPEDLLTPDFIGYLCVSEEVRLKRIRNRPELTEQERLLQSTKTFRDNVVAVYNRIIPKFHPINAQLSKKRVSQQVIDKVIPLLPKDWIIDA